MKKPITETKEYRESLKTSPRRQNSIKPVEIKPLKTPVEIVGFSRKSTQVDPENKPLFIKEDKIIDTEEILTVRLAPAKTFKSNGKLYENLNENNYDEILGNMTNRFGNDKNQDFNDLLKKKLKKVNFDKRKQTTLNIDSKLNSYSKDSNIKLLEKKYKKLINTNNSNIGNLNSSSSNCRYTPNFDVESQILKDLNIFKTNSKYESFRFNLKDPKVNENVNFRLNSLADGLHDLNSGRHLSNSNLNALKPLNTTLTKTNRNIFSS